MSESLMERLEMARRQQFVGRQNERNLFQTTIATVEMPFFVLYLFGPGGVGKSSLLREFAHIATQLDHYVVHLDGRSTDANPDTFLATLQTLIAAPDAKSIFTTLEKRDGRTVLLIDTAEMLFPLDGWLQDNFLPQLPQNSFVVIAGRNPPSLRWRTDPGWQQFMRVLPIKNLSQEESRAFLMRRQIPARQHDAILNFTHGHPLALSLVADVFAQQPTIEFRPENAPDIIKTLMEQFMQEAPSTQHRAALEACSQVRLLNEPLLGAMLRTDDPHPIFEWLRGLSFMDSERRGLYPHDLAREALAADLRWRNPSRQVELHTLARNFYVNGFYDRDARQQRQILSEYIFLHRDNPMIRAYFEWQSSGTVFTDSYQESDREAVLAIIRQHEGGNGRSACHTLAKHPAARNGGSATGRGATSRVVTVGILRKMQRSRPGLGPGSCCSLEFSDTTCLITNGGNSHPVPLLDGKRDVPGHFTCAKPHLPEHGAALFNHARSGLYHDSLCRTRFLDGRFWLC